MNSGANYSLADIAAATGSNSRGSENGMWGGDGAWWIIILFLFVFCGWGNNGWGGFGGGNSGGAGVQGALTREQACIDNNFQNLMRETAGISDAVNVGFANLNSTICQQQYDTAQMINGLGNTIQGGFNAANVVALQNQNALQSQIAQCCCENREGQAQINYNLATQSCDTRQTIQNVGRDIIDSQNAGVNAILGKLTQQEIEAKNAQIAALNQQLFTAQLAASQGNQTNQIINTLRPFPVASYQVCNPFTGSYGYNYNNGCGCGTNYANVGCGCC